MPFPAGELVKQFPLETLLRTREHRERRALQLVNEQRLALTEAQRQMDAVQARLDVILNEEKRLDDWLAGGPTLGDCGVTKFTSIDARRGLLRERAVVVNQELRVASERVDQERRKLAECLTGYRRARAKKDSAEVQRERWQTREKSLAERRDEHLADEYTLSRYLSTERTQ
jgi:hypothetical protein